MRKQVCGLLTQKLQRIYGRVLIVRFLVFIPACYIVCFIGLLGQRKWKNKAQLQIISILVLTWAKNKDTELSHRLPKAGWVCIQELESHFELTWHCLPSIHPHHSNSFCFSCSFPICYMLTVPTCRQYQTEPWDQLIGMNVALGALPLWVGRQILEIMVCWLHITKCAFDKTNALKWNVRNTM